MKVKVIEEFVDKYTGELHTVGSSFECNEARFKELEMSGSFVKPAIEKEKKKEITEITE